jgi:hypothetical protein
MSVLRAHVGVGVFASLLIIGSVAGGGLERWHVSTVEDGYGFNGPTSIAVDYHGQPQVAFYDHINGDLMLAKPSGDDWVVYRLDTAGDVGHYNSMVIRDFAEPSIAYQQREPFYALKYIYYDGGWRIQIVDQDGSAGWYTSLRHFGGGRPAISYRVGAGCYCLRYASRNLDGRTWTVEIVDNDGNVGEYTSLAFLPGAIPAISYYHLGTDDLMFAWKTAQGWQKTAVDTEGNVGQWTSLAILPSGQPAISYYDKTNGWLKYAWHSGDDYSTGWQTVMVDDDDNPGANSSLTILPERAGGSITLNGERFDLAGQPIIAYHTSGHNIAKFAWFDGSVWRNTVADAAGNVGNWIDLAVLNNGEPIMSYCRTDWNPGSLVVAKHVAFGWTTEQVAGSLQIGQYGSIDQLPDGRFALSYHLHVPEKQVWYAEQDPNDPTEWIRRPIYTTGNTGYDTALCIPSLTNQPIIFFTNNVAAGLWAIERVATDPETWETTWLDEAANGMSAAELPSGAPAVAYCAADDLKLLERDPVDPAIWHEATIDAAGEVGLWARLAVSPATGQPAISYYDKTNEDLKYAERGDDGVTWDVVTVDWQDEVGSMTGLVFLADDQPGISYYDATNQALKFVRRDPVDPLLWHPETVVSDVTIDHATAIGLAEDGQPVIVYQDLATTSTRFARYDGSNWQHGTLAEHTTAYWAQMLTTAAGQRVLAYYNVEDYDLEFARAPFADADDDCDVDLDDWTSFIECQAGPGVPPTPQAPLTPELCLYYFDFDEDADVDLIDATAFQAGYLSGP